MSEIMEIRCTMFGHCRCESMHDFESMLMINIHHLSVFLIGMRCRCVIREALAWQEVVSDQLEVCVMHEVSMYVSIMHD